MCRSIMLSKRGQATISQCPDCKMLNVWQHNLLLNFTPEQFKAFKTFTSGIEEADAMFPFPDGEDRFVLRTPNSDICFTFSLTEWEDLMAAMEEAEYMQSVYQILHQ